MVQWALDGLAGDSTVVQVLLSWAVQRLSLPPMEPKLSAILALAALSWTAACASSASTGVPVSVNPHAAELPAGEPPLVGIATMGCTIANAYHVSSDEEVDRALGYPDYGKPKILSDDAGEVSVAEAERWIARACEAGAHYEHFDAALGPAAMSAVPIDGLGDFPATSREVLSFIAEESCVSDLETPGSLSRRGTELLWNDQPVSLVGHSWMGAVAGLNFDIEGYLDVLADHRVNLTRVWAVEQWTGLAVDGPETPRWDNALLPFRGDASAGELDPTRIRRSYVERLKRFVREAGRRGIVVQLTLFDRHGLLDRNEQWGRWRGSPYNRANNGSELFAGGPEGSAPRDFVSLCDPRAVAEPPGDCSVQRLHDRFVRRLRDALAGEGNVIFEVMNEPLAGEWGEASVETFHRWVAGVALGAGGESCFDRE